MTLLLVSLGILFFMPLFIGIYGGIAKAQATRAQIESAKLLREQNEMLRRELARRDYNGR